MRAALLDPARLRRVVVISGVLLTAMLSLAMLLGSQASGAPGFSITVTAAPGASSDVVALDGSTYAAAKAELNARAAAGSATIPVTLTGMPALTAADAAISTDDAKSSLAVQGSTTVLGKSATLLVTATWPDALSTNPEVAVLVRFESVGLADLNPSWNSVPVAFGPAVIGLTDTAHTVTPSATLDTDGFLSDGIADTDDAFPLSTGAINLSAAVSDGAVAEAAAQLGDPSATTAGIRLRGTLSSSFALLGGLDSGAGVGLDISVEIPVATPATFPSWVTLSTPWTVQLAANSGGQFSATFSGGMSVAPDGETKIDVTASATVAYTGGVTSLTVNANLPSIPDLFGQSWLDLNGADFRATIDNAGFAGSVHAGLTVGTVTADVTVKLAVASGSVSASLDLTATGPVSSSSILATIGGSAGSIDPSIADVQIKRLALHVAIDKSATETSVTVAVFGDAQLKINSGTFGAQMLFRLEKVGQTSSLMVSARLTSPTLKQLDPSVPFDWKLPDVALVASNEAKTIAYDDMDTPTQLYFEPVLCEAGTCGDLELTQGLVIRAQIELPEPLEAQLGKLGITVNGPINVTGTVPVLGGTKLSLEVALPAVIGGTDDLVKSGTVSFSIATDTITRQVEASIDGKMLFRVSRSSTAGCVGADGAWSVEGCYDELTLTVSVSVTASATGGVELNLTGTISEWDQAFGVDWLNIETLRLQLGLKAGGTSPVSITIGMLGQFVIGDATDNSDLTLAFKLEITPTPPWINLSGFTAASGEGIRLQSVAKAFDPSFDASTLPDLSLKKIWLAYGTETDESLCIRQGVFLSAELHLGAPPATGSTPGCLPDSTIPDDPASLPTASCESADTCLASILIDVQTGSSPSFAAAGFIRGFDAGPIHIDSTSVVLQLSATNQRFYLSGGASIDDITGATNDEWASGNLTIDFRNDAGNASLYIAGNVSIGGSDGLTASLTGNVAADFSKLSSGDIETFLKSLDYDLSYSLTYPALDKFGNQVNVAFTPVTTWVDTSGKTITDTFDPNSSATLQSFVDLFAPVSSAPQYEALQGYTGATGAAATSLQNQADSYYNYISDYWQLGFYDVILPGGNQNARIYFMNQVGVRLTSAIDAAGGLGNITLDGIDVLLIPGQKIGLESIKDFSVTVAGVCSLGGSQFDNPICGGGGSAAVQSSTIAPLAGALFTNQTTYTLPTATANRFALRSSALTVAPSALGTRPANEIEAINRLDDAFTSSALDVKCATVVVHYSPAGNVQDPAVVTLNAYGTTTSVEVTLDPNNARQPISPKETVQDSINTILSATTPPSACKTPEPPVGPGGTTITIDNASIDEGGIATIRGVAEAPSFGKQVTITWGDGFTDVVTASAVNGAWSASHTYPDDTGPGTSSRFLISATAQGVPDANFTRVTVANVGPTLSLPNLAVTVDEGSTLTVAGSFADPGLLDGHTLVVAWGDGTPDTTLPIPAGATTSFSVNHRYVDDNPSLTPSDIVKVVIGLRDSDGAQTSATRSVTVKNLDPTNLKLDEVTVGGTAAGRDNGGYAIVPEGSTVTYRGSFRDAGISDAERVSVDWGDGTRGDTATVVRDTTDPTLLKFSATHTYVDDDPTTSSSDLYTVTLLAADDDTGAVIATDRIRVQDLAAVVTVNAIAATTENVAITMSASYTDAGTADTHTAKVDWGDGTALQTVAVTGVAGGGSLTATHTYGDNGTFTVTVSVTDDDSLTGSKSTTVIVNNTAPTVLINRGGTTSFDGVPTVVGTQSVAAPFAGTVTDPGSDDETVTWLFGDTTSSVAPNLVNPPGLDPMVSPSIQPRSFLTGVSRAYTGPCLYTTTLRSVDDDGGRATPDSVAVVVLASAHRWETNGFWKNNYSGKPSISNADLACYLKIVEHTSEVFGPGDPVAVGTLAQARTILFKDTGTSAEMFDRELLITWLNVANGAIPLTTSMDFNGDGRLDGTVATRIANAERVRLAPASTKAQIDAARKTLTDLQRVAR